MNLSISHYPADGKRARTRLRLIQISARANYSSLHSRTKWRWPTVHGVPVLSSVECFDLFMENCCIISLQPVVYLEYRRSQKYTILLDLYSICSVLVVGHTNVNQQDQTYSGDLWETKGGIFPPVSQPNSHSPLSCVRDLSPNSHTPI